MDDGAIKQVYAMEVNTWGQERNELIAGFPVPYSGGDVLDLAVCSGSLSDAVLSTNFREERVYLNPRFQAMLYHQGKPGEEVGAETTEEAAYWLALWFSSPGSWSASFLMQPRPTCSG